MRETAIAAPRRRARPDPEEEKPWKRADCPCCGKDVVSNCYYLFPKGYIIVWECVGSLAEEPTCSYRRVL